MGNKKFTRVFIGDSSYALLLYLLTCNKETIESTYYFFSNSIPPQVYENLKEQSTFFDCKEFINKSLFNRKRLLQTIKIRLSAYKKWPILKTADLYGQEISWYAPSLIKNRKFICFEDGISTYRFPNQNFKIKIKSFIKSLIMGPTAYPGWPGRCKKNIKTLILTGLYKNGFREDIPHQFINIKDLWENASKTTQSKILEIYGITTQDLKELQNRKILVLTQPLSQDLIITRKEEIILYKNLLINENYDNIVIKTHPREIDTSYEKIFPGAYVFRKKVPAQLFNLLNIPFEKVYTLFSTAAFDYIGKAEVIFKGTDVHPNCIKRYGKITLPDNNE